LGYLLKIKYQQPTKSKACSYFIRQQESEKYTSILTSGASYNTKIYPLYPDQIALKSTVYNGSLAFNINSKNTDRVLKLLEWVQASQSKYDLINYGIKGIDYNIVNGEVIESNKNTDRFFSFWNFNSNQVFTNIDYIRPSIHMPAKFLKQYKKDADRLTKYTPHIGFNPKFHEITEKIASVRAKAYSDYTIELFGTDNPINVDEFIKKQK